MQIDMHFAGTYLVARTAGFSDAEAQTIADSAQYVDDSTQSGFVSFDNGALFERTATAHRMVDQTNLNQLDDHLAWLPFHFLPGNSGLRSGDGNDIHYPTRLICTPNSFVAQDMVAECIRDQHAPEALHRLGITAHVFVDTYAHQGFAGMMNLVNVVTDISGTGPATKDFLTNLQNVFRKALRSFDRSEPFMLGHGLAHTYPDLPWLNWSYRDGTNQPITRNNLDIFVDALDELCKVFRRYRAGNATEEVNGLDVRTKELLRTHLLEIQDIEPEPRLAKWSKLLENGIFPVGSIRTRYSAAGWREKALGIPGDFSNGTPTAASRQKVTYPPSFMTSDWVLFHNAAKDHRYAVVRKILPKYGLCAA